MSPTMHSGWLNPQVDESRDHVLGPANAQITLVEYGSYACPIAGPPTTDRQGPRPVRRSPALRVPASAADRQRHRAPRRRARRARPMPERFWQAHVELMTRSETLTEDDLRAVGRDLGLAGDAAREGARQRKARVAADERSARASGVMITPTFFINGRRYDGPWDESSLADAMLGTARPSRARGGARFRQLGAVCRRAAAARDGFGRGADQLGLGPALRRSGSRTSGFAVGDAGFSMSCQHWVNDGLLTIFFLVVGLEIKREFTVGHLASRRAAALPVAGGDRRHGGTGGALLAGDSAGPWAYGWGVPMATDTAFAVALIVMMGSACRSSCASS